MLVGTVRILEVKGLKSVWRDDTEDLPLKAQMVLCGSQWM